MGVMPDTNVLITLEKTKSPIDFSKWDTSNQIYISAVTVSELLVGVHRANTEERKKRRRKFVDLVVAEIGVLAFTLQTARVHSELYAELAAKGLMIGAHDLLIAATACQYGLSILTENLNEFNRVPGLNVIPFQL
jgi:tRNA(fMet)-specific endonuclease VapC